MGGVAAGRDPKKRPGVQDDPSCEEALLRSFGGGGESGGLGCEVIGKLGEGSEGVVYVVQERGEGGKRFAVKAFKARNKQGVSTAAVREVKLLRELKHDNVVRLRSVHVAKPERRVFLSYECCSTDLQQLIRRHHANRDPIPEYTVKSALWQLLRALDYLHSSWVVHRDVKPENVLVDRETGACKIADFGCAKVFRNDPRALRQSTGAVVTLWYRAPELLLGCSDYSPAIDVWALGCVFAEMLRLRPLFHSEQRKGNRYARVLSGCVCVRISKSKNFWQNRADSPPPLSLPYSFFFILCRFQAAQMERIISILGRPSGASHAWRGLHHWRHNTDGVADYKPPKGKSRRLRDMVSLKEDSPALDLLRRMLEYDPNKRVTAAKALEHEYFRVEPFPGSSCFEEEAAGGGKRRRAGPNTPSSFC